LTDLAKLAFEVDTGPLRKAADALDATGKSARRAAASTKTVETSMSRLERASQATTRAISLLKQAFIAYGAVRIGQSITNTAIAFQKMETTLKFATGSMQGAQKEIQFLRRESERLGQDFLTAGRAYSKLAAAGSALGVSTEEIRKTFVGVSSAATVMGLSAFEAEGAFNALQQMLAKGKVQAEELRGQLGERIPTAIADGAAAMGMSVQQLSKALDNGEVQAREFVTKLSAYWVEKFGNQIPKASENANIAITDFGNAVQEVQLAIARSGFLEGLTEGMRTVAEYLRDPAFINGARAFGENLGNAFAYAAENAETVLRVLAAMGGALKGASLGVRAGPQSALFGSPPGGPVGLMAIPMECVA
jgi:tape measure domain-containing protein